MSSSEILSLLICQRQRGEGELSSIVRGNAIVIDFLENNFYQSF